METILKAFGIQGAIDEVAPFGLGHINDSYRIWSAERSYFLQRLNTEIFRDVNAIENNLQLLLVNDHSIFVRHYDVQGALHHKTADGVWRLTDFKSGFYSLQAAENLAGLAQVASGFGKFIKATQGLDATGFVEPIPQFHDLDFRWQELEVAIKHATEERSQQAHALIQASKENYRVIAREMEVWQQAGLSLRICHNDCKINNCLLSETDHTFGYVVDLDTVGPGYVYYDFGDLMRTCLVTAPENEPTLSKLKIKADAFEVLSESFLEACGQVLTQAEKGSLVFGGIYMTFIMGIRFLADFLRRDQYYKVSHAQENLIRARNQFYILEQVLAHKQLFEQKVRNYGKS